MRKALFAVLTLSTVALPGCIFAIGSDRHHWNDGVMSSNVCDECEDGDMCGMCQQMQDMQAQLTQIERHMKGECKPDCPYCKPAAGSTDSKTTAPAAAPAATKPASK